MIMDMDRVRPEVHRMKNMGRFLGWSDFQLGAVKPLGKVGWYFPTIKGMLYLDKLKDREVFEEAGLDFDELCSLVNRYNKLGWTKQKLNAALERTTKVSVR